MQQYLKGQIVKCETIMNSDGTFAYSKLLILAVASYQTKSGMTVPLQERLWAFSKDQSLTADEIIKIMRARTSQSKTDGKKFVWVEADYSQNMTA